VTNEHVVGQELSYEQNSYSKLVISLELEHQEKRLLY
jgi:hypothetical protein